MSCLLWTYLDLSSDIIAFIEVMFLGSEKVMRAVEASMTAGVWTIFIILDTGTNSIADIKLPVFSKPQEENDLPSLVMKSYLDVFPFKHYIILGDSEKLPETVCTALQQWIQLTSCPE